MARILQIREPWWNPADRVWVLKYVVADEIDSKNVSLWNELHLTGWKMTWNDGLFWIRGSGGASLR